MIEGIIHRDSDLSGHLLHELDVLVGVGVGALGTEGQAHEIVLGGDQRQNTIRPDAIRPQQVFQDRKAGSIREIADVIGLRVRSASPVGLWSQGVSEGVSPDDDTFCLQDMQAEDLRLGVE